MTISQEKVLDLIRDNDSFSCNNLGFILTVLRDNCCDDDLHGYLDLLVKELYEKL